MFELGKVLFLHGLSSDGGRKTAFIQMLGYDVLTPRLSDWSFRRAVQTAQDAFGEFRPDVIVGSSRGGAVAMSLKTETPMVLIAPAWRWYGMKPELPTRAIVIHSPLDKWVSITDSRDLCRRNPGAHLVEAGEGHRLNDPAAQRALAAALAMLVHCPTDQDRTNAF